MIIVLLLLILQDINIVILPLYLHIKMSALVITQEMRRLLFNYVLVKEDHVTVLAYMDVK